MRVMLLTEHHLGGCKARLSLYLSSSVPFSPFAKVLKQAITEIWVMGRIARKPKVVAFQQRKGADQPERTRSLISDFVVQSLECKIDKLAIHTKFQHSS